MNCPREPRGSSANPLKSATKESYSRGALQKNISADLSSGTSRKDHTVGVAFFHCHGHIAENGSVYASKKFCFFTAEISVLAKIY